MNLRWKGGEIMENTIAITILKELREFKAENNKRWEENDKTLQEMNERIVELEESRKKDRKDILEILDIMQNMINKQFTEMREYDNAKFEKIFATQRLSDIEEEQFRKIINIHDKRLNFYNARLEYLEEWKEQFDLGEYTAV